MMSFCSEAQYDILQVALKVLKYFVAVKPNYIFLSSLYISLYTVFLSIVIIKSQLTNCLYLFTYILDLTVRLLDLQIVLRIIRNLVFIKFQVRRKTNLFVNNGYTTSDVQVIFPKTQAFSFVLLILNRVASSETYRYLARTIFTTFVSTCYF